MDTDEQNGRRQEANFGQTSGQVMTEQILAAMKQQTEAIATTMVSMHG
jgi:hypothetical protein